MKKIVFFFGVLAAAALFLLSSCEAPITLTSWKNPENKSQVSKVVVMPLFESLNI